METSHEFTHGDGTEAELWGPDSLETPVGTERWHSFDANSAGEALDLAKSCIKHQLDGDQKAREIPDTPQLLSRQSPL